MRFFFRTPGRDLSYFFLSSVKWACMVESIVRTCAFAYKHSTLRAQLWQPAAVCNWLSLVEIDHMSSFQWMSIEMTWASKKNGARALGGGRPEKRWHLEEIWAWMINSNFLITDQVLFHNKQDNLTRECMLNVNYPDSRRFLSIKLMVNIFALTSLSALRYFEPTPKKYMIKKKSRSNASWPRQLFMMIRSIFPKN